MRDPPTGSRIRFLVKADWDHACRAGPNPSPRPGMAGVRAQEPCHAETGRRESPAAAQAHRLLLDEARCPSRAASDGACGDWILLRTAMMRFHDRLAERPRPATGAPGCKARNFAIRRLPRFNKSMPLAAEIAFFECGVAVAGCNRSIAPAVAPPPPTNSRARTRDRPDGRLRVPSRGSGPSLQERGRSGCGSGRSVDRKRMQRNARHAGWQGRTGGDTLRYGDIVTRP
jgi:hypothetical protein